MSNNKRIALITGSSQGIGKEIKSVFEENNIICNGISIDKLEEDDEYYCDIQNEKAVKSVVNNIINKYNKIDILVNNAGIVSNTEFIKLTIEEWNRVINVNLTGMFICIKHVLPIMLKNQYGKIINISSIAGRHRSLSASAAYTASKYGVIGLTKQLAYQYARNNININAVCPSQTETEMLLNNCTSTMIKNIVKNIPAKRLAKPSEIAHLVYYLTKDEISYINGAAIDINGGQL